MFKNIRAKHLLLIPAKIVFDILFLIFLGYILEKFDLFDIGLSTLTCVCIGYFMGVTTIFTTINILAALLYGLLIRKH